MIDEFGSDNIGYNQIVRGAVEPMQNLWWQLRKKEPTTAEELVGTLEKFINDLNPRYLLLLTATPVQSKHPHVRLR